MSLLLLGLAPVKTAVNKSELAQLARVKEAFQCRFQKAENASVLWAMLTGDKSKISGKTMHAFKEVNLSFLFHLGGLQLSSILLLIHWAIKKWIPSKKKKWISRLVLMAFYFLPLLALKRLILLRLINLTSFFKKYAYQKEIHFFLCFAFYFLTGHYLLSPGSFVASFLYMGTFISFADSPRKQMILAMIANQFLLAFCWQQAFNPVGVILSVPLFFLAGLIAPLGYCYLLSFKVVSYNWIELGVELFLMLLKIFAKFAHSMQTIPSVMLLVLVWLLLFKAKPSTIGLIVCFCSSVATAPIIFY